MTQLEFICLANSRREGGRCIAGIRTGDSPTWVRPIPTGNGPVQTGSCRGFEPLDVVAVEVRGPVPDRFQPENWELVNDRIRRIRRLSLPEAQRLLRAVRVGGPNLLGNTSDRIPMREFEAKPATESLAVLTPEAIEWRVESRVTGSRRVRADFTLGGARHSLPVTDPVWESKFASTPVGSRHPRTYGGVSTGDELILVASLGAPFNGFCYKFIATVLAIPA